uniref:Plastocyanin-like domain-containing protein n=1 Tax=Syphacia muris TaxID=451379 RepID=A0A0N5AUW0_9BILA
MAVGNKVPPQSTTSRKALFSAEASNQAVILSAASDDVWHIRFSSNSNNRAVISLNGGYSNCLCGSGIPLPVGGLTSPYGPYVVNIPYWMGGAANFAGPWTTNPSELNRLYCRFVAQTTTAVVVVTTMPIQMLSLDDWSILVPTTTTAVVHARNKRLLEYSVCSLAVSIDEVTFIDKHTL